MKNFEHATASSVEEALTYLGPNGGRDRSSPGIDRARVEVGGRVRNVVIAGGTDLIPLMQEGIETPTRLVDVKRLDDLGAIHYDEKTGLRLGALVTLDQIDTSDVVRRHYSALAGAVRDAATPQIRNVATIAGNLCQRSRCWYFRGPFDCWLKGGAVCFAKDGENEHHAILGGGPCYTVHPSDPAVALTALDAEVRIHSRAGERVVPVEQFVLNPNKYDRRENDLRSGELIAEIRIPAPAQNSHGVYLKAMDRHAWAFALVSVAIQATFADEQRRRLVAASVVLGGVAPTPWRVPTDDLIADREPGPELAAAIGDRAVEAATPLGHNGYKLTLARNLIARALLQVSD